MNNRSQNKDQRRKRKEKEAKKKVPLKWRKILDKHIEQYVNDKKKEKIQKKKNENEEKCWIELLK